MIVSFVIVVVILNVIVVQGYNSNNRYINSIIRKHKYDTYRRNKGIELYVVFNMQSYHYHYHYHYHRHGTK